MRWLTLATAAGGAIRLIRASYCSRAAATVSVCVAGTPVPLSSSAWIWGSTGIVFPLYPCDRISSRQLRPPLDDLLQFRRAIGQGGGAGLQDQGRFDLVQ